MIPKHIKPLHVHDARCPDHFTNKFTQNKPNSGSANNEPTKNEKTNPILIFEKDVNHCKQIRTTAMAKQTQFQTTPKTVAKSIRNVNIGKKVDKFIRYLGVIK